MYLNTSFYWAKVYRTLPIQQKSPIWENLGRISSLFCSDKNFNFSLYNQGKYLLTECRKAHSNLLPKFHFAIRYEHNFAYSAKVEGIVLLRHCLVFYEPAFGRKGSAKIFTRLLAMAGCKPIKTFLFF
jgi:hypothetical protein